MLELLLALVSAASPQIPSRTSAGLMLADGRHLALPIRVEVTTAVGASLPGALTWQRVSGELTGSTSNGNAEVMVRLAPSDITGFALEATIRYRASVEVEREVMKLKLPGPAMALGRDLALSPIDAPIRVDRGTPLLLVTPTLVVQGGRGISAARFTSTSSGSVELQLILDDRDAHPFSVYEGCLDRLPGSDQPGPIQFAALEKKASKGRVSRRKGEIVTGRVTLYPVVSGVAPLPLVMERWPDGTSGAVVFTDHADRTDPDALRALLHGNTLPVCIRATRGFLGHGVKITKSFFLHARTGGLDEPETAILARELLQAGSEVASHSISGEPDERDVVKAGLSEMAPFRIESWIDHQPYTNCEAISNQGWRSDGRYGIRQLLADAGYRWLWAASDVAGFTPEPQLIDLFSVGQDGSANPPVFPLPMEPRLWIFQSSMFYGRPERMAAAISEDALSRLEERHGLFVGHTYFSASTRTTSRPENLAKLVVRTTPGGGLEIDPTFDAALGRIGEHVRMGRLASLTWAEAGERLRALGEVELHYLPDGSALVENHGTQGLPGFTVAAPRGDVELSVEGQVEKGRSSTAGRSRIWFDLPPGDRAILRASRGAQTIPLVAIERTELELP